MLTPLRIFRYISRHGPMLQTPAAFASADSCLMLLIGATHALRPSHTRGIQLCSKVQVEFVRCKVSALRQQGRLRADTVIMNPPFGTRRKGADMDFLRAAFHVRFPVFNCSWQHHSMAESTCSKYHFALSAQWMHNLNRQMCGSWMAWAGLGQGASQDTLRVLTYIISVAWQPISCVLCVNPVWRADVAESLLSALCRRPVGRYTLYTRAQPGRTSSAQQTGSCMPPAQRCWRSCALTCQPPMHSISTL